MINFINNKNYLDINNYLIFKIISNLVNVKINYFFIFYLMISYNVK